MSHSWQFRLKPSFLKLVIQLVVLSAIAILAAQMMAMHWVALLIVILCILTFLTRDKQPVMAFSQLDQEIWTIARRPISIHHKPKPNKSSKKLSSKRSSRLPPANTMALVENYRLVQVTGFNFCCWLTFQAIASDTQQPKLCTCCVMIDQLQPTDWRKLNQLKNFY